MSLPAFQPQATSHQLQAISHKQGNPLDVPQFISALAHSQSSVSPLGELAEPPLGAYLMASHRLAAEHTGSQVELRRSRCSAEIVGPLLSDEHGAAREMRRNGRPSERMLSAKSEQLAADCPGGSRRSSGFPAVSLARIRPTRTRGQWRWTGTRTRPVWCAAALGFASG